MFMYTSILHYYVTLYYKYETDQVNAFLSLSLYFCLFISQVGKYLAVNVNYIGKQLELI